MVRTLFAIARVLQPAVIFIEEIDSLLTKRSENENEASRRTKTEFLIQLDGAKVDEGDRMLIIGATNRPQELNEAARRRLVKRLYIPLPNFQARRYLIKKLSQSTNNEMSEDDFDAVANLSEGLSGADLDSLCREAAMNGMRESLISQGEVNPSVPPLCLAHLRRRLSAFRRVYHNLRSTPTSNGIMYSDHSKTKAIQLNLI